MAEEALFVIAGELREHFGIYSASSPLIGWLLFPFSGAYFSTGMKIRMEERHSFFFLFYGNGLRKIS